MPAAGVPGFHPIAVMARDEAATLIGGAVGTVNWNWLHINLVWVAEALRHTGLGTRLLAEIERAGVARGCTQAHLDTCCFQARPFYERIGYTLFGTLDEYPPGQPTRTKSRGSSPSTGRTRRGPTRKQTKAN